jgi:hypothetical protein
LWLARNFRHKRRGWKGKNLPEWFFKIDKERFFAFLEGWIDADGYRDKMGRVTITTKEKNLAMMAQLIALKFGKIIGIKKLRINDKTYYKLILTKNNKLARIENGKLFVKIRKLEEIKPDPRINLYNFQVEEDESYCTTLVTLHNCQIHKKDDKIWVFTRRLENVTEQFPDIVELTRKGLKVKECIVEGEAIAIDSKTNIPMPFQVLSQRIHRKYDIEKMAKQIPIQVNLFDVVYADKKILISKPFIERRKFLEKIIKPIPEKFQLAKQIISDNLKELEKFYHEALNAKQEGIFLKVLSSPYIFGRHVGGWYKIKPIMETLDLVIIGAEWGTGTRTKWLSSYVLACRDPDTGDFLACGMMGTGLTEDQFQLMTDTLKPLIVKEKGRKVYLKPKIVVEVAYQEIQKSPNYESGFALRFPRLVRVREDKSPEEADSIERVKELFKSQGKAG